MLICNFKLTIGTSSECEEQDSKISEYETQINLKSKINNNLTGKKLNEKNASTQEQSKQEQSEAEIQILRTKLSSKETQITSLQSQLQQEQEKNQTLTQEIVSLKNTNKIAASNINEELRQPMLNIVSSILKVYGTKSYLNTVELSKEDENENDTSDIEVFIHYSHSAKISQQFKEHLIRTSKDKDNKGNFTSNK